jgi:hypothetical protein
MREVNAYRTYLICRNPISGIMWIEKDGIFICYVPSLEEGKCQINSLLD